MRFEDGLVLLRPSYCFTGSSAQMFSHPRYVIKGGEVVLEDGEIREAPMGREFIVRPPCDPSVEEFIRPLFEDCYTMSFENYPVELERIEHPDLRSCINID